MDKTPKYTQQTINPAPDTGNMLRLYFKQKRTYQSGLARMMNRKYTTIAGYKKRPSIQTAILWELCHALKHNFFADIATQLPVDYTVDAPMDTDKNARIQALEESLHTVTIERDLLLKVVRGGD